MGVLQHVMKSMFYIPNYYFCLRIMNCTHLNCIKLLIILIFGMFSMFLDHSLMDIVLSTVLFLH